MNPELRAWIERVDAGALKDVEAIHRALTILDRYHRERWQRHVSAGDSVVDRWERAARLGFGTGTSVYDSALVIGDVRVGEGTWIGPGTILDGSGGLSIGDHCSISAGVQIYSHDTVRWALSGGVAGPERASTRVGSNTYVGPNTIVAKGVSIGNRCVIGAASLVLQDVPDGSIAYGTPAKVKGKVDDYLAGRTQALAP